ncbi:MAG TPA: HPF/RaiA family ribosome-associated protein [Gemmatimonadales bacterium]|nr:HPF/RaiA family ribosome-associated protein [Gemmatimonadales bacterium]
MVPLRIAALNFELSPELEQDLRKRMARLTRFYSRIVRAVVTIDTPQRRRRSDAERYRVRLELMLPGGAVAIGRQPHADLRTAFQDAFSAARRRLEDYARRQHGAVKAHETLRRGRVSQYYPLGSYGFIEEAEDGHEVYFDAHSVLDGALPRVDVGAEVRFTEEPGQKGPQATSVHIARGHVTVG